MPKSENGEGMILLRSRFAQFSGPVVSGHPLVTCKRDFALAAVVTSNRSLQSLFTSDLHRLKQVVSNKFNMSDNNHTHSIADYLAQLLKDRKQLAAFPSVFVHVERLLDEGRNWYQYFLP